MRKFLCICEGGNVRSVSLAFALKCEQQQALACGWRFTNAETLTMLCTWADYIVVMQREMKDHVPQEFSSKVRIVDVGPDRYGSAFHKELLGGLRGIVNDWKSKEFCI